MIGNRMRQARESAGLSVRELARKVGVSAMAISKYENGKMAPASDVLLRIGNEVGVKTEYFFRPISIELKIMDFRKHRKVTAKSLMRIIGEVRDRQERWCELADLAPALVRGESEALCQIKGQIDTYDAIEDEAEQLRKRWKLGSGPIRNLISECEDRGILVFDVESDNSGKFDGLVARVGENLIIVINKDLVGDRQRFTVAHEIAHVCLKDRLSTNLDPEKACNRFAGAFLVPRQEVFRSLGKKRTTLEPRELHILKHDWGLSMGGWIHRAHELGILSDASTRKLWELFRSQSAEPGKSWKIREPGQEYLAEKPSLFEQCVFRALAEQLIGEPKAAELLGMKLKELRDRRQMELIDEATGQ